MKLKSGLVSTTMGDDHLMIPTGEAGEHFNGLIRNNQTAQEIMSLLEEDIEEDEIVDIMFDRYDASRDVIAKDVHNVIVQLEKAGFLIK